MSRQIVSIIAVLAGVLLAGVSSGPAQAPGAYVLGPDDQVLIRVLDAPEIEDKAIRIDASGKISVPLAGEVHAAGLTTDQLKAELTKRLSAYLVSPSVTVTVAEYGSQPVSVLGAVNQPGVQHIHGPKPLFEVLSLAGGLRNDAGNTLKITRAKSAGPLPLHNVSTDPTGQFYLGDVRIRSVMEATHPEENIMVLPNDVITIPRADLVYVVGAVKRAGGFVLNEREDMSVLQALSMAEGLDHLASPASAKIVRQASGGQHTEIPINVSKILEGKENDQPLQANDVLFIPSSGTKNATLRAVEAAIQMGTGLVIWRR